MLLVDPDRAARTQLAHLLTDRYAVYEAEDGLMALRLASMIPNLAVVVSEMELPTLHGLDLAKVFKSHALLTNIPFVFLSTGASANDVHRFLAAGASRYLYKSLKPRTVARIVTKLTARD